METTTQTLKNLPHAPGVYKYTSKSGELLYVGKAKDLKKRVSQYFQRDDAVGAKTPLLVSQIAKIETIKTSSEFDAILLEARLIHDLKPKYNVVLKDDKSPLYILLTIHEQLPRILLIRRSDIPKRIYSEDALFGPFQSSRLVRTMLRQLRYSIPYCTQKQRTGRSCFYTHIGLCKPCPSVIEMMSESENKQELIRIYRSNVFKLKDILSGKSLRVLKEMEQEMNTNADSQNFETAAIIRNHIEALRQMITQNYDPSVYINNTTALTDILQNELRSLQAVISKYIPDIQSLHRIECVDISNTQGTNATGSLVVLTDGIIDTSQYRKFRIQHKNSPNDFAMMQEVITRRFNHPEWPKPNLLIVDGGKGQVTAAQAAIPSAIEGSLSIPVIGIAKREEELIIPVNNDWKVVRIPFSDPALHLVQRIRDEAHRFAITYHRLLRRKSFV